LLNLKTKEIQEYPIEKFFFSVDYLGNNEILTTGDDSTNYKISIYNLINKNIVKEFGVYDNIPNNIPFNSWRLGNEGFVFHNKISKKAIIALRYSDKIDFFSNLDGINYTLFGPERFEPEFKITKGYKDSDIIQRNEKTRFAYLSGVTTDKYIYLLYSGNQHESKNKDYGKTIFVFDWDGKPILRINLPVYVSGFTVSKTDEQIFVSEPINKTIYSFKINL
jgi:hypothetical protein